MGCFIIPMAAATATVVFRKKVPERYHIGWLNMLLWGGVFALVIDHIAQGEIVPYPPFLSAMSSAAGVATLLQEMATLGTAILVGSVIIWACMVFLYNRFSAKTVAPQTN